MRFQLLSLCIAAPVLAGVWSPPVDVPLDDAAWFDARVAELDADAFARRDAAATELEDDPRCTLELIEARLNDPRPLSPEQRERLARLGVELFEDSPRGAMGVQFSGWDDSDGVEVGATIPNFDARRVLEIGDIIRELGGMPVTERHEARAGILSHDPGEEVVVRIERRGEPMAVTLRLGKFNELRNNRPVETNVMRAAWELRRARAAGTTPATAHVLTPGPSPERWAQLIMQEVDRARRGEPEPERPTIVRLAAGGEGRVIPEGSDTEFSLSGPAANLHVEDWKTQIRNQQALIQRNQMMLRNGNLGDGHRRKLQIDIDNAGRMVSEYRRLIRKIQATPPADTTPK